MSDTANVEPEAPTVEEATPVEVSPVEAVAVEVAEAPPVFEVKGTPMSAYKEIRENKTYVWYFDEKGDMIGRKDDAFSIEYTPEIAAAIKAKNPEAQFYQRSTGTERAVKASAF